MKTTLEMVKEFHEKFGHPVRDAMVWSWKGDTTTSPLIELRLELLKEELNELANSLRSEHSLNHTREELNAEVLDALCDLQVVLDGAFLALGFWKVKQQAMEEVHRSNMSKLGADGKPIYRADGKILKGPNYTPPNLEQFVK